MASVHGRSRNARASQGTKSETQGAVSHLGITFTPAGPAMKAQVLVPLNDMLQATGAQAAQTALAGMSWPSHVDSFERRSSQSLSRQAASESIGDWKTAKEIQGAGQDAIPGHDFGNCPVGVFLSFAGVLLGNHWSKHLSNAKCCHSSSSGPSLTPIAVWPPPPANLAATSAPQQVPQADRDGIKR